MRNLKRALSLTLASVMLLGMMVVGTSAASFPDVTAEDNVEAIEVLAAVSVLQGYDDGQYHADTPVTRNQMATIICRMMGWRDGDFAGLNPFPDVPDWAANYVAACVANGIINGRDDGRFHGDDTVTATEAASMMLRALGYTRMPVGADWARAVAQQASKINLFDELDVGAYTALTRGDVSQLALNTMESAMVEVEDNTLSIDAGNGVSISGGQINYVVVTSSKDYAKAISRAESSGNALNGVNGPIVELGEHVFNGDLKKVASTDAFGAPSTRWTYKNVEVGNYAETEDYKFEGTVKSEAMYAAVGKTAAEQYQWTVKMDGVTNPKDNDGSALKLFSAKDVADNDSDDLAGTARGTVTYVHLDDTAVGSYAGTATVCIVNTYAAEVIKVTNKTITLSDGNLEFDTTGYAEDDIVLYTKSTKNNSDWTVETILGKAELVQGEADTIRNADRVVIGDKTYQYSYRFNNEKGEKLTVSSVDQNVAFYLDKQGNIIRLEDADESNDFAYVYSVGNAGSKYGRDSEYGAQLIFTDGKKKDADIDKDTTDKILKAANRQNAGEDDKLECVKDGLTGQIVSYTVEDDGAYSLTIKTNYKASWSDDADKIVKAESSRVDLTGGTVTLPTTDADSYLYANKNSAILVNEQTEDNDKFGVYTGYEALPNVKALGNYTTMVAYKDNGVIRAMYIMDAEVSGSEKDVVFVKGQNSPKIQKTGSNEYYVYTAYVDGEVRDILVKVGSDAADTLKTVEKGEIGVYFGISENSSGYVTKLTTKLPDKVKVGDTSTATADGVYTGVTGVRSASNGLLGFGWNGTDYTSKPRDNEDIQIVYMSKSDSMSVKSSISNDREAGAYVVTDDGEVIAVLIDEGGLPGGAAPETPGDDTINPDTVITDPVINTDALEITVEVIASATDSQVKAAVGAALKADGYDVTGYTGGASGGNLVAKTDKGEFTVIVNKYWVVYVDDVIQEKVAINSSSKYVPTVINASSAINQADGTTKALSTYNGTGVRVTKNNGTTWTYAATASGLLSSEASSGITGNVYVETGYVAVTNASAVADCAKYGEDFTIARDKITSQGTGYTWKVGAAGTETYQAKDAALTIPGASVKDDITIATDKIKTMVDGTPGVAAYNATVDIPVKGTNEGTGVLVTFGTGDTATTEYKAYSATEGATKASAAKGKDVTIVSNYVEVADFDVTSLTGFDVTGGTPKCAPINSTLTVTLKAKADIALTATADTGAAAKIDAGKTDATIVCSDETIVDTNKGGVLTFKADAVKLAKDGTITITYKVAKTDIAKITIAWTNKT